MSLLDWFSRRDKPLSKMTREELRREELRLQKERTVLLKRIEKAAKSKKELFNRGAAERIPEVRQALAMEFESQSAEQLMVARQLNIRTKEMLTVSRLRMLRENAGRAGRGAAKLGMVRDKDIVTLARLIENDAVTTEMYQQRLNEVLALGAETDRAGIELGEAGKEVMNIWEKMDAGLLADNGEAFEEADRRMREHQTPPEAGLE